MNFSGLVRQELGRALRNHKYEQSPDGVLFPASGLLFGGTFGSKVDDGPWVWGPNAVSNEFINAALNVMFDSAAAPVAWYMAPFSTNVAPTSALTAATFAGTQGEYTSYTQSTRQVWTPNSTSTAQNISNTNAPSTFTIGAGSPVTLYGAGLLTASAKGATTGILGAAGLFGTANTLNAGSSLLTTYQITATAT